MNYLTTLLCRARTARSFLLSLNGLCGLLCLLGSGLAAGEPWKPAEATILTRWAEQVTPDNAWREYPRPQMVREGWMCLNGLWDFTIVGEDGEWKAGRVENAKFDPLLKGVPERPSRWEHKILVPFSPETPLSGVGRNVRPNQVLWYRRAFTVPRDWQGKRVLLHFEAVDWHAIVLLNGKKVGENKGGYVSFTCDLSDALKISGEQELVVVAWDPTNMGDQSVGKQSLPEHRRGFRYTPNSGIWQSVWLEPVPERAHVHSVKIVPNVDARSLDVVADAAGDKSGLTVRVVANRDGTDASGRPGRRIRMKLNELYGLWSPENPQLHDLTVELRRGDDVIDSVSSYFSLRKIDIASDAAGVNRIRLNGKVLFQFGPLDQGYWPDGAMTPPCDEAARYDVQYLRDIGCNMVRVHVTVHPRRWYYHCDTLGLLVWQDFVCTRKFEAKITPASAAQFELERRRMMDRLGNHPSIVMWILFNEGWGQYDTERLTEWAMKYDPSRLVTCASGWTDYPVGHVYDNHDYSFNVSPAHGLNFPDRAALCGECGGVNVLLPGHLWHKDQTQQIRLNPAGDGGRENYSSVAQWETRYRPWLTNLRLMQPLGLNAAVYTQMTDVEHEFNGWLTYDREVSKFPAGRLGAWHRKLYEPIQTKPVFEVSGGAVRYFRGNVPNSWASADFDDLGWKPLGSSSPGRLRPLVTPAASRGPLHLRGRFTLDAVPEKLALHTVGTGQWNLYLNGEQVMSITNSDRAGFTPYSTVLLPQTALDQLRKGENIVGLKLMSGGRNRPQPALCDFGLLAVLE